MALCFSPVCFDWFTIQSSALPVREDQYNVDSPLFATSLGSHSYQNLVLCFDFHEFGRGQEQRQHEVRPPTEWLWVLQLNWCQLPLWHLVRPIFRTVFIIHVLPDGASRYRMGPPNFCQLHWLDGNTACSLKSLSQILHHLALFFSSNKYCLLGFIQNKIECEVLPQILALPDWQRLSETHQELSQSCYFWNDFPKAPFEKPNIFITLDCAWEQLTSLQRRHSRCWLSEKLLLELQKHTSLYGISHFLGQSSLMPGVFPWHFCLIK